MTKGFAAAARRRRFAAFARLACVTSLAAVGGCDLIQPPADEFRLRAFHERDFVDGGDLAAQLDDVIVMHLEPSGTHDGDTGLEEGVDEFVYEVTAEQLITFEVALENQTRHWLSIHALTGEELIAAGGDAVDSAELTLGPGRYLVRIHHGAKGDPQAETSLLFLSGEVADSVVGDAASKRGPRQRRVVFNPETHCGNIGHGSPKSYLRLADGCAGCFFVGAKFDGLDLSGANLRFAKWCDCSLDNANLAGTVFGEAFCEFHTFGVPPRRPFMAETSLRNANLDGASLVGVEIRDNCDFTDANLRNVAFAEPGTDLFGEDDVECPATIIQAASIRESVFTRADLSGSQMTGVDLSDTVLNAAKLQDAILDDVALFDQGNSFDDVSWSGASLRNIDFTSVTMRDMASDWSNCDFGGADLTGQDMSGINLRSANLSGQDLSDVNITGVDLSMADLSGAILSGATVIGALLEGVNFQGADLSNLDLSNLSLNGADLTDATLDGVRFEETSLLSAILSGQDMTKNDWSTAHLQQADLSNTTIEGQDWTGYILTGVKLVGAKLSNAVFVNADLSGVDLSNAEAFGANFEGAIMANVTGIGAHMDFCNLPGANLMGTVWGTATPESVTPATFNNAYMPNVNFQDADLRNVDFSGAHIYGDQANIQNALMAGVDFSAAIASGLDFTNAKLTDAVFNDAQLVNCKFVGAVLSNARFETSYLQGADFTEAVLTGANFTNAALSLEQSDWSFVDQDGQPYSIVYGPTILPDAEGILCPNGTDGPCDTDEKKTPLGAGPFPEIPECVPSPTAWCPPPQSGG